VSEGTPVDVLEGRATWSLHHGDCLELLRALPDNSVDALVTDPPSGISFMSRSWDKDKGGRDKWIAWLAEIMREALRVLKPGAHGFVWALPRTSHWTAMALEDAGFEVRDSFHHLFSTGFPKSLNASKAIDARLGAERPVVGIAAGAASNDTQSLGAFAASYPATEPAKTWNGWGTAVKPAHEVWWLIRKPMIGTLAENLLAHGTGALNIDASRIGFASDGDKAAAAAAAQRLCHDEPGRVMVNLGETGFKNPRASVAPYLAGLDAGRWPANLVLSHHADCKKIGVASVPAAPTWDTPNRAIEPSAFTGSEVSKVRHANGRDGEASADKRYAEQGSTSFAPLPGARRDDEETVDQWDCVEGCAVSELAAQSGESGSSSKIGAVKFNGVLNGGNVYRNTRAVEFGFDDAGHAGRFFMQLQEAENDSVPFSIPPNPPAAKPRPAFSSSRVAQAARPSGVGTVHPEPRARERERDGCRVCSTSIRRRRVSSWCAT
jgi:hypothetical protein